MYLLSCLFSIYFCIAVECTFLLVRSWYPSTLGTELGRNLAILFWLRMDMLINYFSRWHSVVFLWLYYLCSDVKSWGCWSEFYLEELHWWIWDTLKYQRQCRQIILHHPKLLTKLLNNVDPKLLICDFIGLEIYSRKISS